MHAPRIVPVVACLVGLAAPVAAQDQDRASLTGIGPINVLVDEIDDDAEQAGLTREIVQTAVELRLRQNRIPLADKSTPRLLVQVHVLRPRNAASYAYFAEIMLFQVVQTTAAKRLVDGVTWLRAVFGLVPASEARNIQERVLDLVDAFSNDYLAVNPQPR